MVCKNVLLVILDGLGDRTVRALKERTPLEAAHKKTLDALVRKGECGMLYTLGPGRRPGSEIAHLALLGYPFRYYTGRGPLEAIGVGFPMQKGDVALRANFGTVDSSLTIIDRRAGRIPSVSALAKSLDGTVINGITFFVKPGTAHRAAVILRGKNVSARVSDGDPHEPGKRALHIKPLEQTPAAVKTASALNVFLDKAHKILETHGVNKQRVASGLLPANYLLVRGAGETPSLPPFSEFHGFNAACVAGGCVYQGIASAAGMRVLHAPGATGTPSTDLNSKVSTALKAFAKHDFVFLHIKATDSFGEDGNAEGKKLFIEKIDKALTPLLALKDALVVITGDHSTPCELKAHSGDAVPVLFAGEGVRRDDVKTFGERACAKGGLGTLRGTDVMPLIKNFAGKAKLVGG